MMFRENDMSEMLSIANVKGNLPILLSIGLKSREGNNFMKAYAVATINKRPMGLDALLI